MIGPTRVFFYPIRSETLLSFEINSHHRCQLISVDHVLREAVEKTKLSDGVLHVFVPHTTAGILINENADPAVAEDILASLERKIPFSEGYKHLEGNSAAHIKASLVGGSVQVPVVGGRLRLGRWQSVFFAEFDGPRRRSLWVTALPAVK